MSTRISAEEARQKTELAKQQAEIDAKLRAGKKIEAETRKKERAKARKLVDAGWEAQRLLLIDAALEGKSHLVLKPPIFRYQKLIELDFDFSEEGWVKNSDFYDGWISFDLGDLAAKDSMRKDLLELLGHTIADKNHPLIQKLKKLRLKLDEVLVRFAKSAHPDVQHYYGFDEFRRILKKELAIELESSSSIFNFKHVIWTNVPTGKKAHYDRQFDEIYQAIGTFKKLRARLEEGQPPPRYQNDSYEFSIEDKYIEVINGPTLSKDKRSAENQFLVWWGTESTDRILTDILFCRVGLRWLTGQNGQKLVDEIFGVLEESANKGQNSLTLNFVLTSDDEGWFFNLSNGTSIKSCRPDDLVEIIERRGFLINDTQSFYGSYKIKVSW